MTRCAYRWLQLLATVLALATSGLAQSEIHWSFDGGTVATAEDQLSGHFRQVPGVSGDAVVFDGYTTVLKRDAQSVPDLRDGFTVTGWIAVAAYPWAAVPLIDQRAANLHGFGFDIGARGELLATAAIDGRTVSVRSNEYVVPHREWIHVAARFDPNSGLSLFLSGAKIADAAIPDTGASAGRNPTRRFNQAGSVDLLVGAVREPVRPVGFHRFKGTKPSWLSFDGLIDELGIVTTLLSDADIRARARAYKPAEPDLAMRRLPSGPPGPGRFGAYLTTLRYYPEWDAQSSVDRHADIVVRFDRSPARVVFWRGTQYSPAWVTGNNLWMADQSVEGYDEDYTWEHMNDKHNRYSHVRVIENTEARVVVHWRYAPVNVNNEFMNVDERDERGAWVDEYYYFYPDVVGVRKVSWRTATLGAPIQYQESIPLAHPGQVQGDVVEPVYATVGNLAGERSTLAYVDNPTRGVRVFPDDLTMQMHHFRSEQKPFIVFEPGNTMGYLWDLDQRSLTRPGSSSHWPVGRIWSDGRTAQAADRATSFLGFPISEPVIHDLDNGRSYIASLYGMTDGDFDDVEAMGRAWSTPPEVSVEDGYEFVGFDRSERLFRFRRQSEDADLAVQFLADGSRPLANIPILVERWGDNSALLRLNGSAIAEGEDYRVGYQRTLDGDVHLVAWIAHRGEELTRIVLSRPPR